MRPPGKNPFKRGGDGPPTGSWSNADTTDLEQATSASSLQADSPPNNNFPSSLENAPAAPLIQAPVARGKQRSTKTGPTSPPRDDSSPRSLPGPTSPEDYTTRVTPRTASSIEDEADLRYRTFDSTNLDSTEQAMDSNERWTGGMFGGPHLADNKESEEAPLLTERHEGEFKELIARVFLDEPDHASEEIQTMTYEEFYTRVRSRQLAQFVEPDLRRAHAQLTTPPPPARDEDNTDPSPRPSIVRTDGDLLKRLREIQDAIDRKEAKVFKHAGLMWESLVSLAQSDIAEQSAEWSILRDGYRIVDHQVGNWAQRASGLVQTGREYAAMSQLAPGRPLLQKIDAFCDLVQKLDANVSALEDHIDGLETSIRTLRGERKPPAARIAAPQGGRAKQTEDDQKNEQRTTYMGNKKVKGYHA